MIDRERLKKTQPAAWRILSNSLLSRRLSHAYLFSGPDGSGRDEMAFLFAQSLLCKHPDEDGFACGECESCRQMEKEEYPDFYWLHENGYRQRKPMTRKELEAWWKDPERKAAADTRAYRIRKEDILRLQDAFALSASSGEEGQVFLLEQYESATPEASNALLKFLEEPKPGVTGLLTTSQTSRILPTIVSRCQPVFLRAQPPAYLKEQLHGLIDDEEMCEMLSQSGIRPDQAEQLIQKQPVFTLRDAALSLRKAGYSFAALQKLESDVFVNPKKAKKDQQWDRQTLQFFIQWLLYFCKKETSSASVRSLKERTLLLETLDALKTPADPLLLLERTVSRIRRLYTSSL